MNRADILAHVAAIIHDSFDVALDRITPEARLHDDLDIDSIDAIDLIVQLKTLIGSRIRPEAFRTVRTVGDVVEAVHALLADPPQP